MKYNELTDFNFEEIGKYAVVYAASDDCPACKMMDEFMTTLRGDFEGLEFYKIDFDVEIELCDSLYINAVPHTIFLYDKEPLGNLWDMQEPITIVAFIEAQYKRAKRKEKNKNEK